MDLLLFSNKFFPFRLGLARRDAPGYSYRSNLSLAVKGPEKVE